MVPGHFSDSEEEEPNNEEISPQEKEKIITESDNF